MNSISLVAGICYCSFESRKNYEELLQYVYVLLLFICGRRTSPSVCGASGKSIGDGEVVEGPDKDIGSGASATVASASNLVSLVILLILLPLIH